MFNIVIKFSLVNLYTRNSPTNIYFFAHRRQKPFGIPRRSFLFRKNFVDEMTHKQHRQNNDMHHKTELNNTKSIFHTLFYSRINLLDIIAFLEL